MEFKSPVSIFGFDCFDDFYFSICTTLKQGSLIPECIERLWLISQAYGFMPALFKSSCKEAASRIGVVSRKPKLFLITHGLAMTYKEFLTVLNLYYFSLCLDDSFQLYLITIVYVQLELYLLPQIVFSPN
jgi:hypothetical protein